MADYQYFVVGFIFIIIVGSILGGKSLGEVVSIGIGTIIFAIFAFIVIWLIAWGVSEYKQYKRKEEYKKEKKLERKLIEKLSIIEKKSTDSNYLYFHNKCNKKVYLYIHYLNTSGNWETTGSWKFDANQSSYLSDSNGGMLKSNNSVLFYSIEGDGLNFKGNYKFEKYGEEYNMKKIIDNYDDTEWSYSCN
jgi:hypothetical protein